jgi:Na+/melibiose symporter-like transporter
MRTRKANWAALGSMRFWLIATVSTAIAAALPMELAAHFGAPQPVQYAIFYPLWILLAILFVWVSLQPTEHYYCPYCGKRAKIGFRTCHHCAKSW